MILTEIPEKFFVEYNYHLYDEVLEYIEYSLIDDFDDLEDLPDDFTEKLYKAELKPVYKFEFNELLDLIPEENLPSTELTNSDKLEQEIKEIIQKHLVSLNKELPEYWYSSKDYYLVTKQELIEIYNQNK
jgi:hypothetical protein